MTVSGATKRIARGRGHSYVLDGRDCVGVTTALREGVAKPALVRWAARSVAGYALDHWSELDGMPVSERLRTLENAAWAERDEAANRGREVHDLVERLAAGEEVEVPDALEGYVDSYERFVSDWSPEELLLEAVVLSREFGYMGTLDLVAKLGDGHVWLLDWKTSGSGIYPEVALQLAAYRRAETYLDANGDEQPMPTVDACGALWLRSDGYDLFPVKAGSDEFRRFQYAQVMSEFVRAPRETFIGESLSAPPKLRPVEEAAS